MGAPEPISAKESSSWLRRRPRPRFVAGARASPAAAAPSSPRRRRRRRRRSRRRRPPVGPTAPNYQPISHGDMRDRANSEIRTCAVSSRVSLIFYTLITSCLDAARAARARQGWREAPPQVLSNVQGITKPAIRRLHAVAVSASRPHLRGDPRCPQGVPRERHPRLGHVHGARAPQDRHGMDVVYALAPGPHALRLRRLNAVPRHTTFGVSQHHPTTRTLRVASASGVESYRSGGERRKRAFAGKPRRARPRVLAHGRARDARALRKPTCASQGRRPARWHANGGKKALAWPVPRSLDRYDGPHPSSQLRLLQASNGRWARSGVRSGPKIRFDELVTPSFTMVRVPAPSPTRARRVPAPSSRRFAREKEYSLGFERSDPRRSDARAESARRQLDAPRARARARSLRKPPSPSRSPRARRPSTWRRPRSSR